MESLGETFFRNIGIKEPYDSAFPIIVVAAHPDDETLGAYSILKNFSNIKVIHTTDGSPKNMYDALREGFETREEYALQRRYELYNVLSHFGIPETDCIRFGVSDQESSYHMDLLIKKMIDVFYSINPKIIFTHSYEGGHPDHDAAAFTVHAACSMMQKKNNAAPEIIEFALYNNYHGYYVMNKFIPYESCIEKTIHLDEQELKQKKEIINFFTTQQYLIKYYSSNIESYRIAPKYNFTRPPHSGKVNYDNFDWGIKNEEWCEVASAVLKMFNLESQI